VEVDSIRFTHDIHNIRPRDIHIHNHNHNHHNKNNLLNKNNNRNNHNLKAVEVDSFRYTHLSALGGCPLNATFGRLMGTFGRYMGTFGHYMGTFGRYMGTFGRYMGMQIPYRLVGTMLLSGFDHEMITECAYAGLPC
jgi:hypothetical protein